MSDSSTEKFLSLKTAAQLYGYTRDHLGLMIRRGKLNGIKLGNYYVTTDNWMIEYVKKYADQNHPMIKNKLSNKFLNDIFSAEKKTGAITVSQKNIKNPSKIINENKIPDILYKNNVTNNIKNDIKSEILKDLALYNLPSNSVHQVKNNETYPSSNKHGLPMFSDVPYTILPIRKMEDAERKSILKKLKS